MTRVAVVPARDEVATIGATVHALRGIVDRVVVADDGSTDGTADAARAAGAEVVRTPRTSGKGAALEHAVDAAGEASIVLLVDADLGSTAAALRPLIEAVEGEGADVAVAVPTLAGSAGLGIVRRTAGAAIRLAGGPAMRAPLSGQRAIAAAALKALRPFAPGFGVETAMGMDAARAGLRVIEIPVAFTHRATGRDVAGFLHRGRQGLDIARAVLPRLLRRP